MNKIYRIMTKKVEPYEKCPMSMRQHQAPDWKDRLEIEMAGAKGKIWEGHKYIRAREKILKNWREIWFADEEAKIPLTDTRRRRSYFCSCLPYLKESSLPGFYHDMGRLNGLERRALWFDEILNDKVDRERYTNLLINAIHGMRNGRGDFMITAPNFLEDMECQLAEHLVTPYSDSPLPPRFPYQVREITSKQLQQHFEEMENGK